MTDERYRLIHLLLLEHGLMKLLEDIEAVVSDHAYELRVKDDALAEGWHTAAGSLRYALRSIDFSGGQ